MNAGKRLKFVFDSTDNLVKAKKAFNKTFPALKYSESMNNTLFIDYERSQTKALQVISFLSLFGGVQSFETH
ncbi:MAG: hypothetical protein E7313_02840 [Clostridiales bacterium]|nr:hypothetical protein [Clostridiales bacterium]